jgi:microcystin-dependent protein
MAQPQLYIRQFDFTGFQAVNPVSPLPGDKVDLELNTAKVTFDQILQNLSLIQRDDGRLMNGSVGQEQLAASLSIGFTFRGVWVAGKTYALSDGVSLGSKFYRAKVSHGSDNTNRPDIGTLFWEFLFDFSALVQQGFSPNARTPVAGGSYNVLTTDRLVAYTSLPASPAVNLPLASAFPNGVFLGVVDESGACSVSTVIGIFRNPASSDTINGSASAYVLNTSRAFVFFESDGVSKWTVVVASALPDNTISTTKIIDQAVTTAKIADNSVTAAKVAANALPSTKIAPLGGLPGFVPVGSEMMWPALVAPSGWLMEWGQAVSRAAYVALFTAITFVTTGNISNGSSTISSLPGDFTTTGAVGAVVEGPGIPLGAFITAVSSTTFTLSQPATAGAIGATIRLLPWGQGDGSTTFNVPDARGYAIVGREVGTTRIASAFDASRLGNSGGEASHLLLTSEMPSHNHPLTDPGHTHTIKSALNGATGGAQQIPNPGTGVNVGDITDSATTSITLAATGGGGTHNNVQPSITRNIIIYAGV